MRFLPITPMQTDILADGGTTFALPAVGLNFPAGFAYRMIDNTGTFAGANMVVTGADSGSVTLSTAYQIRYFVFIGGAANWA